ncbi:MAG: S8 family serine peptidase [Fimbriimonadales bacterium]
MRRTLLFAFSVCALLAGAYQAIAQQPGNSGETPFFIEQLRRMEFTGEMIVRPLEMSDAIASTGSHQAAAGLRERAARRLATDTRRYYPETDEYIIRLPKGSSENSYARRMMATGDYQYVEPNWRIYPVLRPNDPSFSLQWHHQKIRSELAWDILVGNPNQIIAYTDTGIDTLHTDLEPNRVPGYNAITELPEEMGGVIQDTNGHGTHVAGIGSAIGNNGIGVTGVGWNFKIMMVAVSHEPVFGTTTIEIITRGGRWAADNGAKTISASFEGVSSTAVETTGRYIRARGALYLYAAGNDGANLSGFDWPNVIVVGATNQFDNRASFSAYGRAVDVFAPGVSILSTYLPNSYSSLSGTSMATPMANGVAAMIWAKNPDWTPEQVEQKLFESCKDLGPPGEDEVWGWGRIDLFNSVSGGTTTVKPLRFSVTRGVLQSGELQDLFESEDEKIVIQQRRPFLASDPSAQLVVESNSPTEDASKLLYRFEASSNAMPRQGVPQRLELWNFVIGRYEIIDERPVSGTDTVVEVSFTEDASRFIEPSTKLMRARMGWFDRGVAFLNWAARIDLTEWEVTP